MPNHFWPTFLFFTVIAVSQSVGRRALSQLSPEQKLSVMDALPKIPWIPIIIALLFGVYLWLAEQLGDPLWMLGTFMLIMLLVIAVSTLVKFYRMKALRLPSKYVWTVTGAQFAIFASLAWMLDSLYIKARDMRVTADQAVEQANQVMPQVKHE